MYYQDRVVSWLKFSCMDQKDEEKRAEKLIRYFPNFGTLIVEPIVRDNVVIFSMREMNDTIAYLEINGFAIYRYDLTLHPVNQRANGYVYVELTDQGKTVKHLGTFEAYDKMQHELLEKEQRRDQLQDTLLNYQVQNERLQSELVPLLKDANKSTVTTNNNIRETNTTMRRILWLTSFIALISAVISSIGLVHEYGRDLTIKELNRKDSIIKHQQIQLFQKRMDTTYVKILSK